MSRRSPLALTAIAATLSACILVASPLRAAGDGALKLYVAASTRASVEAIARQFELESGIAVEVSPGPSSKLAKQIAEGAPADLFLSADQANVDYLASKQLVASWRMLLGNRLVVVTPADSPIQLRSLEDLAQPSVREVALALEKVPAGEYARQALRAVGVWDRVEPKVVGGEDVSATLAFVQRGATAGIVYLTDTVGSSKVRVAFEVDPSLHRPIEYPLALIQREPSDKRAQRLYDYLFGDAAAETFRRARFEVRR